MKKQSIIKNINQEAFFCKIKYEKDQIQTFKQWFSEFWNLKRVALT